MELEGWSMMSHFVATRGLQNYPFNATLANIVISDSYFVKGLLEIGEASEFYAEN